MLAQRREGHCPPSPPVWMSHVADAQSGGPRERSRDRAAHAPDPHDGASGAKDGAVAPYAPFGPGTVAILRDHRERQLEERLAAGRRWHEADFVFASRLGTPLDARNVTQALQTALGRLCLPRTRFHDFRYAYATLMLEDGEDLAVVSKSLGHANLSTTADIYAHLTLAMQDRAAARMDRILGHSEAV